MVTTFDLICHLLTIVKTNGNQKLMEKNVLHPFETLSSGEQPEISVASFAKNHTLVFTLAALKLLPSSGNSVVVSNPVLAGV